MNSLLPQWTFQCSQWISSGEHLAVNSSKTVTLWLLVDKGKDTTCDVAYGKTQRINKTVPFIVILEIVKRWQGKDQRKARQNIPRPQLITVILEKYNNS